MFCFLNLGRFVDWQSANVGKANVGKAGIVWCVQRDVMRINNEARLVIILATKH